MSKLLELVEGEGATRKHKGWLIFCPGCKCAHVFDSRWTFNGDQGAPTFRASMLVGAGTQGGPATTRGRCHSFVTDGRIQFLTDSTHPLAGQTVELPDWDE